MRRFGPKTKDHPSCGEICFVCKKPMLEGEYTTLVPLGPGEDEDSRQRAAEGRAYNTVAIEVHWECSEYPYKSS